MQEPNARNLFGEELWGQAVNCVSYRAVRSAWRRRALVAAWSQYQEQKRIYRKWTHLINDFGDFPTTTDQVSIAPAKDVQRTASVLMKLLTLGTHVDEATRVQWLQQRWLKVDPTYLAYLRIQDPQAQMDLIANGIVSIQPGDQWLAGWEKIGAEFANTVNEKEQP